MIGNGLLRLLIPHFREPAQQREFARFHDMVNITAMRWGLVSAVVLWCMAWCMGLLLRPHHADRTATALACVLPFYAALAWLLEAPGRRHQVQSLLALSNLTAGFLVLDVSRFMPAPELVRPVGLIMVTFYAVLALRMRPAFAIPTMLSYNVVHLVLLWQEGHGYETVFVHAFLLGMSVLGAASASVVLERNVMTLFRQRRAMDQQQRRLAHEHARSERLLRNVLPGAVADRLKDDPGTVAERYDQATILFADLVDFTRFSDQRPPEEVLDLLNMLFSRFDELVQRWGLEKIKTIGDAYMVAGGLPLRRPDHAHAMAGLALAMQAEVGAMPHPPGFVPTLRIGIHTGPVMAGVIGRKRIAFDVWGDTVNTASRLQALARPGGILVSEATAHLITDRYAVHERGSLPVKGKGTVRAFALWGQRTPLARMRIA